MAQSKQFVGIDVGKHEFFVYSMHLGSLKRYDNTSLGIRRFIADLSSTHSKPLIALEPTGGLEWALWHALTDAGYDARQVPASHVRFYARAHGRLAKTDKIDAKVIAGFIAFRPTSGRKPPAENMRIINMLSQKRRQLVAQRKTLKIQIQNEKTDLFEEENAALLEILSTQIKALDTKIEQAIEADRDARKRATILRSIPGVGPVLCASLVAQMPELGCENDRKIAALAGLAPMDRQSGRKDAKRSIFGGRKDVRALLYQAAIVASVHNPALKTFAQRLKVAQKPHKVVMIAVARKLLTIANTLLAKNMTWQTK